MFDAWEYPWEGLNVIFVGSLLYMVIFNFKDSILR